jgi:phosphoglycolate phosphatase
MYNKAIFLDLDGTLIDSRADLATAINLARADFGLDSWERSRVAACVGDGLRQLVSRTMPELHPEQIDLAIERARIHYRAHMLDQTTVYDGVFSSLKQLIDAGWQLAVVTNKPSEMAEPILKALELWPFLGALAGGGEDVALKPDPALLHLAAKRLGYEQIPAGWMVGDHHTDMEVGRRAGLKRCFCRYGFGQLGNEAFDMAVDTLLEFAKAVS